MIDEGGTERVRHVGYRLQSAVVRAIAAVVVLTIFLGLAYLVYLDRLSGDALLLYSGVILGYLLHASKQAI